MVVTEKAIYVPRTPLIHEAGTREVDRPVVVHILSHRQTQ